MAEDDTFENLYPALVQCFTIILCGYMAGRFNIISETETRGFHKFIGTFSLPALIFMSLSQLAFKAVNWWFLLAILLAKTAIFLVVIAVTLLCSRDWARAGLFAIFCTQSNDFAIGYPIVKALYSETHPDYALYLYLMAPISLALLNPIGLTLMECSRRLRNNDDDAAAAAASHREKHSSNLPLKLLKSVLLNPIIAMTVLGIVGNVLFTHRIPIYLGGFLELLGAAFPSSALFLLGLHMVGKIHKLRGPLALVPIILILVKLVVLPLVAREMISLVNSGSNATDTTNLSTFGFLYGTFPTAPTVFLFATQYQLDGDLVASAMVMCTFLSAPLMFTSARMIAATAKSHTDYVRQLVAFSVDVSSVSCVACLLVVGMFLLTRKLNRLPHKITAFIIVSQLLTCVGVLLAAPAFDHTYNNGAWFMGWLSFVLYTFGVYSTRLWTMILAVVLVFLQCRTLCFIARLQPLFIGLGWGVPAVIVVTLALLEKSTLVQQQFVNPYTSMDLPQIIITTTLLVLCLIVIIACLILHHRISSSSSGDDDDASGTVEKQADQTRQPLLSEEAPAANNGCLPTISETNCEDIEDLFAAGGASSLCAKQLAQQQTSLNGCPQSSSVCLQQQYRDLLIDDNNSYWLEPIEVDVATVDFDPQLLRHICILVVSVCSIFIGVSLAIWTLISIRTNPGKGRGGGGAAALPGIYVELSYADAALQCGQGIVVFAVFAFDNAANRQIWWRIVHLWRTLVNSGGRHQQHNSLSVPHWDDLEVDTRTICEQFRTYHLVSCKRILVGDKWWPATSQTYRNVFTGTELVDWLIRIGLVADRIQAVNYAKHLVEGSVVRHINGIYHFHDSKLLYTLL